MSCLYCGSDTEGGEFCPKCGKSVGAIVTNLRKEPTKAPPSKQEPTLAPSSTYTQVNFNTDSKPKKTKSFFFIGTAIIAVATAALIAMASWTSPKSDEAPNQAQNSSPNTSKNKAQPTWSVPSSCKLNGIARKYQGYEFRNDVESQGTGELACSMVTGTSNYLTYRYKSVTESFAEYQKNTVAGHALDGYGQLSETVQVDGQGCNAYTVYSYPGANIPLYWTYILCGHAAAEVIGNVDFDPSTYKTDEFLQAIAKQMKEN
jgi:hypothetical protein